MRGTGIGFGALLLGAALVLGACAEGRGDSPVAGRGEPRVVMLTASYCPICREMEPLVDELAARCRDRGVAVEKIDVAEERNEHLLEEHRVVGVPTFLFMDGSGAEVARLIGRQPPETLNQALAALGGQECPGLSRLPR